MVSVRKSRNACLSCGASPALVIECGPSPAHKVEVTLCDECFQRCVDLKEGTVNLETVADVFGGTKEVTYGGELEGKGSAPQERS